MTPDKRDLKTLQKLHELDQETLALSKWLTDKYRNRYVTIMRGWRKGEKGAKAIITGGCFHNGSFLFLCMAVNKKDEIINGDAWTRGYRPFSDIELIV
jgi:hypothetical protein